MNNTGDNSRGETAGGDYELQQQRRQETKEVIGERVGSAVAREPTASLSTYLPKTAVFGEIQASADRGPPFLYRVLGKSAAAPSVTIAHVQHPRSRWCRFTLSMYTELLDSRAYSDSRSAHSARLLADPDTDTFLNLPDKPA